MADRHNIVLVPGFFGFDNLGELTYFIDVSEYLVQCFAERGLEAEVTEVVTLPTASIRHRAARLLELIAQIGRKESEPIHVIGHSTGGLDARLAIAPTAALPTREKVDPLQLVQSLVTVSCPHYGTPLATSFASVLGKPLLSLFAVAAVYVLQRGKLPINVGLKLGHIFSRLDDYVGLRHTVLDELYAQLLADFSDERRQAIVKFLDAISSDQSLLFQLTPAGIDLFNATTADPNGVRYGSVTTRAPSLGFRSLRKYALNFYAQSMHLLYAIMHRLSSRADTGKLPALADEQKKRLIDGYGALPSPRDNDGIVPTLSQVWGDVIHVTTADHLDVVGHYGYVIQQPLAPEEASRAPKDEYGARSDWLPSASGFNRAKFEALWRDVANFLMQRSTQVRTHEPVASEDQTVAQA